MIKCCIFDLDGTLLDTLSTITYYLNVKLRDYSLPEISREECRDCVGAGAMKLVRNVLAPRGVTDEENVLRFYKEYTEAYDSDPYHLTEPYEGIHELIDTLNARGVRIAVLSNKPDFATRSLINRYFGDKIPLAHGGREGVPLKPAPDGVYELMSELGVTPAECAYIGDSEIDVRTFLAANVAVGIAVTWGFRTREQLTREGATVFADTPSDILTVIDRY